MGFLDKIETRAAEPITRRNFLRLFGGLALGAAAMGVGGWTYATKIEPAWVDVVQVDLRLPRLDPVFAGFRLAQISDIHLSEALTGDQMLEVSRLILAQKPDLVAITGDFLDRRGDKDRYISKFQSALRALSQAVPVLAVLGNHDYSVSASRVRSLLTECGVRELNNEVFTFARDAAFLHFGGLDDIWKGDPRLGETLAQIPETGAAVLLAHEPDYADISSKTGRFDLQISGHSHGGQVVLPLIGAPVLPHLGEKYYSGLYRVSGMYQYTNRGLGTSGAEIRFNCRPEITLFTFQPESQPFTNQNGGT